MANTYRNRGAKWVYFLAEFFNAVSLSLLSGAFLAYLIDQAKPLKLPIHNIIRQYKKNSFLGMAIASLLGTFVFDIYSGEFVWLTAGSLCILQLLFTKFLPKDIQYEIKKRENPLVNLKKILRKIFNNIDVRYGAILFIIITLYYQILIQYWQPLAKMALEVLTQKIFGFGLLFSLILFSQSVAGKISSKIQSIQKLNLVGILISLLSLLLLIASNYYNKILVLPSIIIMYAGINIISTTAQSFFHKDMDASIRATADALISTTIRILLMFVMPIFSYLVMQVGWVIMEYFWGAILALVFIVYYLKKNQMQ